MCYASSVSSDATCLDADGLKWFNWEYLQVTAAVEARVAAGDFSDPTWLAELDVQFARLYFRALENFLTNATCPNCWQALFIRRNQAQVARIQFTLAGINAHINHDLPSAIVASGQAPRHGTTQYKDYTAINTTLDSLIDEAKRTLHVRLLGDPFPPFPISKTSWPPGASAHPAKRHGTTRKFSGISLQSVPQLGRGLSRFARRTDHLRRQSPLSSRSLIFFRNVLQRNLSA